MRALRERPVYVTTAAFALAVAAVLGIAAAYGFGAFGGAFAHLEPGWIVFAGAAMLLALPAYALAYRAVAQLRDGPELSVPLVLRVVTAGFGAHVVAGGFAVDKRALHAIEGDEESAKVRVLGLGALEWALLAPAAVVSAAALLAEGDPRPMRSLLWPWVIAAPAGFAVGLALATPRRVERLRARRGGGWIHVARTLEGISTLHLMARTCRSCARAWIGMALYWAFDIAAFYGAVRAVGLRLDLAEAILAYGTGYALTRRSMPLGGAGVTEVLMTFALHWVGQPVAASLAVVVIYRAFNLGLAGLLALAVRSNVHPLLESAGSGQDSFHRAHARAGAPFWPAGRTGRA